MRSRRAFRVLVAKALMRMANSTMIEIDIGHDKPLMDCRAAPKRRLDFNGKTCKSGPHRLLHWLHMQASLSQPETEFLQPAQRPQASISFDQRTPAATRSWAEPVSHAKAMWIVLSAVAHNMPRALGCGRCFYRNGVPQIRPLSAFSTLPLRRTGSVRSVCADANSQTSACARAPQRRR